MAINLLVWIIAGTVIGFLSYIFFGHDRKYVLGIVLSGVVGSFVGGIAYLALSIGSITSKLEPTSIFWAIVGSLGLVVLTSLIVKSEDRPTSAHHA